MRFAALAPAYRGSMAGRNAVFEKLQPRAETERLERLEKVLCALREMRPAMAMNGDYCGGGKSVRRLDRIVSGHLQPRDWPRRVVYMAAFQATETPRATIRASVDPSGTAMRCSVSNA